MNKQQIFDYLDGQLADRKLIAEYSRSEGDYSFPHWVLCEELVGPLVTYVDDVEDQLSRMVVSSLLAVVNKDYEWRNNNVTDYIISFNLLERSGWEFDWGTNIFGAWINWEGVTKELEATDEPVPITEEVLKWMLEWLTTKV